LVQGLGKASPAAPGASERFDHRFFGRRFSFSFLGLALRAGGNVGPQDSRRGNSAEGYFIMATAQYDCDYQNPFDDDPRSFHDGFDVADSGYSDAVRAAEDAGVNEAAADRPSASYHRIAEVRRQQGVTLRNVARRLGIPLPVVRRQEQADCDMRLSELLRWQEVLEVPVAELLVEGDDQLSGPVLERSRMVKLMKTVAAIRERSRDSSVARMVDMLVEQILEIMPELADVTPWHSVGQRRSRDDLGRTASRVVSEDLLRRPQQS
jgi:transcriptional regulator with XRE-family HTH domain